jgi:hypothetical protein
VEVVRNTYDGADWWGTVTVRNTGESTIRGVTLALELPEGVSCDYTPKGWTKAQSHERCTFRNTKAQIAPGKTLTLNYSTNSQNLTRASNLSVKSSSCGGQDSPGERSPEAPKGPASKGTWRRANLTRYESYPAPGSDECVKYSGCQWAGRFAGLDGKMSEDWVKAHNIVSVHSKDFETYKGKTLRIRRGTNEIQAKVYDECRDSDCDDGECCSRNSKETGFLLDLEKYTAQRFREDDGVVEWSCEDCD